MNARVRLFQEKKFTDHVVEGRNVNHIIRRVVKTLGGFSCLHRSGVIYLDDGSDIRVSVPVQGRVSVDDKTYNRKTWFESFPG